jgi:hypothetical protein
MRPPVPEKRLPLLETAGFDLLAQVEGMLREVRLFQDDVQRIRDLVTHGNRDVASRLLTEGGPVAQMKKLRRASVELTETLNNIEAWMAEERSSRA